MAGIVVENVVRYPGVIVGRDADVAAVTTDHQRRIGVKHRVVDDEGVGCIVPQANAGVADRVHQVIVNAAAGRVDEDTEESCAASRSHVMHLVREHVVGNTLVIAVRSNTAAAAGAADGLGNVMDIVVLNRAERPCSVESARPFGAGLRRRAVYFEAIDDHVAAAVVPCYGSRGTGRRDDFGAAPDFGDVADSSLCSTAGGGLEAAEIRARKYPYSHAGGGGARGARDRAKWRSLGAGSSIGACWGHPQVVWSDGAVVGFGRQLGRLRCCTSWFSITAASGGKQDDHAAQDDAVDAILIPNTDIRVHQNFLTQRCVRVSFDAHQMFWFNIFHDKFPGIIKCPIEMT